ASHFIADESGDELLVDLLIGDELSEDWLLFSHETASPRGIILRRPADPTIGTADYVKAIFPANGKGVHFVQKVITQNDNDYVGMGGERFGALV
ncbi:hypothetical protein, partial [Escherichia coli]|uniref:hypothetical protein n=1 Tax=Escherichia coli TaxID=562 RepID=UPI001411DA78